MVQLQKELHVNDAVRQVTFLDNRKSRYTVAFYYHPCRLYYISIPPVVVAQYISGHLASVMEMYFGYFSRLNSSMALFNVSVPEVPSTEDYAKSAN